jgi:hypothetical protein
MQERLEGSPKKGGDNEDGDATESEIQEASQMKILNHVENKSDIFEEKKQEDIFVAEIEYTELEAPHFDHH